ncbi:hypothetical protein [Candidatus Viridilinea mediisalina]|uniref:Uncharacterized protein n=1 Tax=Candidatus Viridilinea mediisalina TaxID=2024553 RepID=A0A2A6RKB0_9CHLR|nr:hypothetical protein [Candidatus Viridilinea mediisalina]PDW03497.1 hypothetical protein CJ255_08420 [Candidatus Viridilinea mediisalina]
MSDPQKTNENAAEGGRVYTMAEKVGTKLAHVGATVVTWPFYLVPNAARKEAYDTTNDLFQAVGRLHLGLVKSVVNSVGVTTHQLSQAIRESGTTPVKPKTPTKVRIETGE